MLFENYVPTFVSGNLRTRFSVHSTQEDYNSSVRSGSMLIPPGEAELDGVKRQIPVGTVIFDPDSWDEGKWEYTRVSEPAKPIENSDTEEEKPAE